MIHVSKEIKIGIVAIAGIIMLYLGMNFLKGVNLFSRKDVYYIHFDNLLGLVEASPIYIDGYRVGSVKEIKFDYNNRNKPEVAIEVDDKMRIPKGTTAEITSDLLGNIQVQLTLPKQFNEYMNVGEVIPGNVLPGLMKSMSDLGPSVEKLLPRLDSILTKLNHELSNPDISKSIRHIEVSTNSLQETINQANIFLARLNKEVPGMVNKTNHALENVDKFTMNLAQTDVAGTMTKVDETLRQVNNFTRQLNSSQGTLGLLLTDPSLYHNFNSSVLRLEGLVNSADSLMIDVKERPKRYVRFSLW